MTLVNIPNFDSLNGLENTIERAQYTIADDFIPSNLNFLTQYPALFNIAIVNTTLTDLSALNNIVDIRTLFIKDNTQLNNLNGLDNLDKVSSIFITQNSNLTNLNGAPNLDINENESPLLVKIEDNPNLTDYCGISTYVETSNLDVNNTGNFNYTVEGNGYNPDYETFITLTGCSQ